MNGHERLLIHTANPARAWQPACSATTEMRILWAKAGLLVPLDKGGNLRTWHLMRHLASRHEITFVSFADPDVSAEHLAAMHEVAARVEMVPYRHPRKGTFGFYLQAARHVFSPLPYAVGAYRSRAFADRIAALCRETAFDVIVCDFLPPALSLPTRPPSPVVLFTHNVEADIWRRHAETQSSPIRRWLYELQYTRMQRFERRTLERADLVLGVSTHDGITFERLYPGALRAPMQVIPTGVDTTYFSNETSGSTTTPSLIFTGSMDWLPNDDAMQYFVREILPLVRQDEPDATLAIVGRTPTPAVQALANVPGVTVTGRVDDVRPFMRKAAVYVVPLRIGGGTRLKIFEAMSMGLPVVSTGVGAEGLPVTPDVDYVRADDPRAFADSVVSLLRDSALRRQIGDAGRDLVRRGFDWSAVAGTLETALERAARSRTTAEQRANINSHTRAAASPLASVGER